VAALKEGEERRMKAEHRKELEKNALADTLSKALEGLKRGPSRGTVIFFSVILVLVLGFLGIRYFWNWSAQSNSSRWLQLEEQPGVKELEQFAKDNSGTMPARIAQLQRARILLQESLPRLCADFPEKRQEEQKKIAEAAEIFEKLADQSKDVPLLAQEALLSAAKAYESLGQLDKAEKAYKTLESRYGQSGIAREAGPLAERFGPESRIFVEVDGQKVDFYSRFEKLAEKKPGDSK